MTKERSDFVDEEPKVYWAERTHLGWDVLSGYYLGCYNTHFGNKYIVTLGNITSCVVRHLDKFYITKKEAWASIADREEEEEQGE